MIYLTSHKMTQNKGVTNFLEAKYISKSFPSQVNFLIVKTNNKFTLPSFFRKFYFPV